VLAVITPGQGSQKPGFLAPWLALPALEARLRWWSAVAGTDLVHLGTEADADEIRDTAKTQPLLTAAALVVAEHLPMYDVQVLAGHSVGELAAAALAGVLTPEAAVTLAAVRGREMAAACAAEHTNMVAVLGGDEDTVLEAIDAHGLYAANRNGAGQIVAAGAVDALDKFTASPPERARVVTMKVAGAFHTPYMAPAEQALSTVAAGIVPGEPTKLMLSNLDGAAVSHGRDLLLRLVRQVTTPVRWDLCMRSLADLGVTAVLELPPAGTLTGLLRRAYQGMEVLKLNTPDDLPAARDLIARHGAAPNIHASSEPFPSFRVVVAAAAGTFEPAEDLTEGDTVRAGQVVGHVATRQGPVEVAAHDTGVLTEWLAHHRDPVAPGQPLARIGGPA